MSYAPPFAEPLRRPRAPAGESAVAIFGFVAAASLPAVLDLPREIAGWGLIALAAIPLVISWGATRRLLVSDPIVIIGLMWVLAAGLPAVAPGMYQDPIWTRLSEEGLRQSTLWMYRGWAAASLAYWGALALWRPRPPPAISPAALVREDRLRFLIGVVGLIAAAALFLRSGGQSYSHLDGFSATTTVDQIIHELRQLSKVYVFLYFYARGRNRLARSEDWLLAAILGIYVLTFAASGSKAVAIEIIAMWALGNAAGAQRGRLARELAIGAAAIIVVYFVFLFVTAYRLELAAQVAAPTDTFIEAFGVQAKSAEVALGRVWRGEPLGADDSEYSLTSMFDRLALVASFATVLEISNGVPPYEHAAETFMTPLYAVLPRNLFADKAQFFGSGELAQMLGWDFGGFAVSLPGSFYWSWGYEGVVLGMAGLGLIIAALRRRSEIDGPGALVPRVALTMLILMMLSVDLTIHPIIISLVRAVLFVLVLQFVLAPLLFPKRQAPARQNWSSRHGAPRP